MAFPAIPTAAGGRILTTTQADTTATRTFSDLSNLTKSAGDLLIAIICGYNSTTNPVWSSWGGGFTEFTDQGTDGNIPIGMAYKWSDGTETGTFTVTQAGTVSGHAGMILLSIAGAHATTPPEAGTKADAAGVSADPGALDPSGWAAEDTLWINVRAIGETSTGGAWSGLGAANGNYSEDTQTGVSGDVAGAVELGVAFRQLNAASEDQGFGSLDTSNALNSAVAVAVRPAPPIVYQDGAATAAGVAVATADGVATFGGLATADVVTVTTAVGEADIDGLAAAATTSVATATGIIVIDGAATAATASVATAEGEVIVFQDGAATAATTSTATAGGELVRDGAATAAVVATTTADGVLVQPALAAADAVSNATAAGETVLDGVATGATTSVVTAEGEIVRDGEAVAVTISTAAAEAAGEEVQIARPISDVDVGGWTPVGALTLAGALSDESNTTYISGTLA